MQNPGGLKKNQRAAYFRTVTTDHERRVRFQVLDLNGRHVADLDAPLSDQDSSVECDTSQTPALTMTVRFLDPGHRIGLEPDVGDYPLYRRRMLRAWVDVRVPELNRWVPCPVFTGPIVAISRDGAIVTVTCHDKSSQAMGNAWQSRTFKKGRKRTDVVRAILDDTGENRMAVAKGDGRLGKKLEVQKMDRPWVKAKAAMPNGRVLFCTPAGVIVCRRPPSRSQWTVPGNLVLTTPKVNREAGVVTNRWQVIGGKPTKKAKKKVRSKAVDLPRYHPDNPLPGTGVGRNGKRRVHAKVVSNDKIKSYKVANRMARQMAASAAGQAVEVAAEIVPVPFLEPYDVVSLRTPDGTFRVRLTRYNMSLTDGSMSIGTKRRSSRPKRRRDTGRGGGKGGRGNGKGRK